MSNSKKSPKKLNVKIGKRSLRAVSKEELVTVGGGDPGCVPSPPPPPCFTLDNDA